MTDYGLELPDTRHTFITTDEARVEVIIIRHWYHTDYDEASFKVSFNIKHTAQNGAVTLTNLPIGTDQKKATAIAHQLYNEDKEETDDWDDTEAICAAERRMGA